MGLKISFAYGSSKEFTAEEEAAINKRLDKVLSPDFGKGRVKDLIDDHLEMQRLGDLLVGGELSAEEMLGVERNFYALADKIRDETNTLIQERRSEAAQTI